MTSGGYVAERAPSTFARSFVPFMLDVLLLLLICVGAVSIGVILLIAIGVEEDPARGFSRPERYLVSILIAAVVIGLGIAILWLSRSWLHFSDEQFRVRVISFTRLCAVALGAMIAGILVLEIGG